jgi:Uma2 family endonuclease
VFLDISPEKANKHNAVKTEITRVLGNLVRERDLGNVYGDGLWITNDQAQLSNEPDATFICWESLENGRIQLIPSRSDDDGIEMRGSPDWVLEVVSNSSQKKDTVWLTEAYHAASVKEYWIVDARGELIAFSIYVLRTGRFEVVEPQDNNWTPSEVFGCDFRLVRERDRIGAWSYTLHTR